MLASVLAKTATDGGVELARREGMHLVSGMEKELKTRRVTLSRPQRQLLLWILFCFVDCFCSGFYFLRIFF